MSEEICWQVAVSVNGETILTIGHNHLAGVDDIHEHEDTIRTAANSLLGFVGGDYKSDLAKCPNCGGPADNGFDRCDPPSPYWCSKCMANSNTPFEARWFPDGGGWCVLSPWVTTLDGKPFRHHCGDYMTEEEARHLADQFNNLSKQCMARKER